MTNTVMSFLVGSQNYGMSVQNSDKDYLHFFVPSLWDLCFTRLETKEVRQADGEHTYKDVRTLPDLFMKSNVTTLQLLYSVEGDNLLSFLPGLEASDLVTLNLRKLYASTMGTVLSRKNKGTVKDLVHAHFLLSFLLEGYFKGVEHLGEFFQTCQETQVYAKMRQSHEVKALNYPQEDELMAYASDLYRRSQDVKNPLLREVLVLEKLCQSSYVLQKYAYDLNEATYKKLQEAVLNLVKENLKGE